MMISSTEQEQIKNSVIYQLEGNNNKSLKRFFVRSPLFRYIILLGCTTILLCSSILVVNNQEGAHAANPGSGNGCSWYTVSRGDTLSSIAGRYHTTYWNLAQVNYIRNVNLIIVGQHLCIPYRLSGGGNYGSGSSGIYSNGIVRWYDYSALDWSNRGQVISMLRTVAARYG
ncbi:MAG: LysM peptidoglycan-binding domain-containing protein, partial [Chloroflexota bacterium]|nr:LysM peptidoglycan-binding domain-containing protein [Chloroflexota bacterium]